MEYYIRTKYGIAKIGHCVIAKRYNIKKGTMEDYEYIVTDSWIFPNYEEKTNECFEEDIIKLSPNIIELIEEGDYVNGSKVQEIGEGYVEIEEYSGLNNDMPCVVKVDDIKSIVTKEQFKKMEYKVVE